MNNLTEEEKEILESFEKGEWHSRGNLRSRLPEAGFKQLRAAAVKSRR